AGSTFTGHILPGVRDQVRSPAFRRFDVMPPEGGTTNRDLIYRRLRDSPATGVRSDGVDGAARRKIQFGDVAAGRAGSLDGGHRVSSSRQALADTFQGHPHRRPTGTTGEIQVELHLRHERRSSRDSEAYHTTRGRQGSVARNHVATATDPLSR